MNKYQAGIIRRCLICLLVVIWWLIIRNYVILPFINEVTDDKFTNSFFTQVWSYFVAAPVTILTIAVPCAVIRFVLDN